MLTFFFTLIFIAEIVLVFNIISFINKCDKRVCELSKTFDGVESSLSKAFCEIRIAINTLNLNLNKAQIVIVRKKDEYKTIIIKNIITGMLFILLSNNGKKIISGVEIGFAACDLVKKYLKVLKA